MIFDPTEHPHRRYNPLRDEWVLVSPHRAKRPWRGETAPIGPAQLPTHDPTCHLCPGVTRATGDVNPPYSGVFIFDNDFPALLPSTPSPEAPSEPLFQLGAAQGVCRVMCFSPDHSAPLPLLSASELQGVIQAWRRETDSLGARFPYVQVFENKGAMMGCSNPHPHGQIWASSFTPSESRRETQAQAHWLRQYGAPLLVQLAERETELGERCVVATEHWVAFVPYWAAWPFETLLAPRAPTPRFSDLSDRQAADLALALKRLTTIYDNLFECSFPYSMGWHGAPFDCAELEAWQLHAHFYPPLLRSASIRKFMVGFEMLAEAQRDLTPEQAADRLRSQDRPHYLDRRAP